MTRKRWIVMAGMLATCVCVTLGVLAMLPPRRGVTPADIARIENGMTRTEVERILGDPGMSLRSSIYGEYQGQTIWFDPQTGTMVVVDFSEHNRVVEISWEPETFRQKLKRLLHL
jgi:hypothetical protein